MARPFDFNFPTQHQARLRQAGECACCGEALDDTLEHAHHVVPNQSGNAQNLGHGWLKSVDNCVILCETCHYRVHEDGRYRTGAVAPPDYFSHSHGNNVVGHEIWATRLESLMRGVWA